MINKTEKEINDREWARLLGDTDVRPIPTGEELVKIMSPLFSTPYITKEEAQAIFKIVPCS